MERGSRHLGPFQVFLKTPLWVRGLSPYVPFAQGRFERNGPEAQSREISIRLTGFTANSFPCPLCNDRSTGRPVCKSEHAAIIAICRGLAVHKGTAEVNGTVWELDQPAPVTHSTSLPTFISLGWFYANTSFHGGFAMWAASTTTDGWWTPGFTLLGNPSQGVSSALQR